MQGLSIMSRRARPEHVLSFLSALTEVARGAGCVATQAAVELRRAAEGLEAGLQELATGQQANRASPTRPGQDSPGDIGEIRTFFQGRRGATKEIDPGRSALPQEGGGEEQHAAGCRALA